MKAWEENIIIPTKFEKIQWSQNWSYQVGAASENLFFPKLDDMAAKVHWPNDGCLAYWIWMPFVKRACFGLLPKPLKLANSYYIQGQEKLPPCLSLHDLLRGSNSPQSIVLLHIKLKSNETLRKSSLEIYKNHHAKCKTWMMMWGGNSKHSPSKEMAPWVTRGSKKVNKCFEPQVACTRILM